MKICVFGASSNDIPKKYLTAANLFGQMLAKNEHILYFGGGATGVMGETVRGVKSCGGTAIGIAPKYFDTEGVLFKDCDEFIYTDTMNERKTLLEDGSDGFAVLPGGIGTYDEFFEVLVLAQVGQMKKPIAIYNVDGCYDNLKKLLEGTVNDRFMSNDALSLCRFCNSADEIFEYFNNY